MLVQIISHTPSAGNGLRLRALLAEIANLRKTQGYDVSVRARMYGEEPKISVATRLEDWAAVEAFRAATQAEPDAQSRMERVGALSQRGPAASLWDIIVPISIDFEPPQVAQRIDLAPLPGHQAEVQALLEERAASRQAEGIPILVARSVLSGSLRFFVSIPMPSLTALGDFIQRNAADGRFQEWSNRLSHHLAAPADASVSQVIVGFNAAPVRELAAAATR